MDNCFVPCGCDSRESVTKADLDRFTDKVENVVNDEKGRKLFRNFMRTCKMNAGCRKLDVLEDIDNITNKKVQNMDVAIDNLLNNAEKIEEIQFSLLERLYIARITENKQVLKESFETLKTNTIKALKNEYSAFRNHYTPSK